MIRHTITIDTEHSIHECEKCASHMREMADELIDATLRAQASGIDRTWDFQGHKIVGKLRTKEEKK